MTDPQNKQVHICKTILTQEIDKIKIHADKLKDYIKPDASIPIAYLVIFSDYIKEKKIDDLEEAFKFMKEIGGIIEKINYVNENFNRIYQHLKKVTN